MKKYTVEYKNAKVTYAAKTLESNARELGVYKLADDHDFLVAAVKLFCERHFMFSGAAHLDSYDAKTRGNLTQNWQYQPNGTFAGWINAFVAE